MPSTRNDIRTKSAPQPALWRVIASLLKFFISPFFLIYDLFRVKKRIKPRWVMYNFTLCCLATVVTGLCLITAEQHTRQVLAMLVEFDRSRENLGDKITPYYKEIMDAVNENASRYEIDPLLICAVINQESQYKPDSVSPAGAKGLMQLMPYIWRDYWDKEGIATACSGEHDPDEPCPFEHCIYKPSDNILVGVTYLAGLLQSYHGHLDQALQAYNAGFKYVALTGQPPVLQETRYYTRNIMEELSRQRMDAFLRLKLQTAWMLKDSEPWFLGVTWALWMIFGLWMWRKGFEWE
ncbi:MAG: lytic transglycosylase domain-containing protein [Bacillota bacterium]